LYPPSASQITFDKRSGLNFLTVVVGVVEEAVTAVVIAELVEDTIGVEFVISEVIFCVKELFVEPSVKVLLLELEPSGFTPVTKFAWPEGS